MPLDEKALRNVCEVVHANMAKEVFGDEGVDAVFEILETVRDIFKYVEPELVNGPIIILRPINNVSPLSKVKHEEVGELAFLAAKIANGGVIEIAHDKRLLFSLPEGVQIAELVTVAVVYEFRNRSERFLAGAKIAPVIQLDRSACSQFSVQTFSDLRNALEHYSASCVRFSSCPTLSEVWDEKHRLFLKNKPESKMRNSLTWFLKVRLGAGYEVRPEQCMDESHPVDIKVTQSFSNRLAIIEIKWLGDSRKDGVTTLRYRDARAREGAQQLADYLEMNKTQAPTHISRGYYVIIDARRRALQDATVELTQNDGLHYKYQEIAFDPTFETLRDDFEKPFRMFAEPICSLSQSC